MEPPLLAFLERRLEQGQWQTRTYPGVGEEYVWEDLPAFNLLHFVSNLPDFRNLSSKRSRAAVLSEGFVAESIV
jgi:hypothetical protein